ncbi:hypothetical protein E2C01_068040 [Portunus trituberculatus]|uniref:Uncharacterized protein n=1 Tax=Portunus trituberculatus TaxID=210409 RepID=A0A5B7HUQ8_PORTR|nr:hypothetical protein [Portunus trituberculatus]
MPPPLPTSHSLPFPPLPYPIPPLLTASIKESRNASSKPHIRHSSVRYFNDITRATIPERRPIRTFVIAHRNISFGPLR